MCKFVLVTLATFVLGTVFIFVNPTQVYADVEEVTELVTLSQYHINLIQEAFDNVVPPRNMRMEINPQDIWYCGPTKQDIFGIVFAPVDDAIDEIVQYFIGLSGPNTRSNITLNEIYIDVDHELISSIRISISSGDFVVTSVGYSFYIADFEAFITQNYAIEPFTSPYNRIANNFVRVNDPWTSVHAVTINSSIRYFRRDDNAIFIQEGDVYFVAGWYTIIDNRLISSVEIWGRTYHSNGTVNASMSQSFRVHHIRPGGGTSGATWLVNVRP
jgi:hypothetical protein